MGDNGGDDGDDYVWGIYVNECYIFQRNCNALYDRITEYSKPDRKIHLKFA